MKQLEQGMAELAEQNMQLQAALRRFLARQGPRIQAVAHAETQARLVRCQSRR